MKFLGQQLQNTLIGLVAGVEEVDHHHVETLTIAMATTDALFDPLRVPGQIIVDQQGTELQVNAFCCCLGGNHDFRLFAEVIDQGSTPVYLRGAGYPVTALVLFEPVLVDQRGLWAIVAATEGDQFISITVGSEEFGQILLGATRLSEDDDFARGS
ncbi:hypothetical protein D3C76_978850 [compost metagenome]